MLKPYLKNLFQVIQSGDAREESYYPSLKEFLENYAYSTGKTNIRITVLPKKTEAGNPDFRIWDGKQKIVGYIEAKNPAGETLDHFENTEQIKRYKETFPNFILTNFFEFRLYRNSQLINQVLMARPVIAYKVKAVPPAEKEKEFYNLLEQFFSFSLPKSYTAESLAVELAKRTRFLKDQVILEELREEEQDKKKLILGFYEAFQKYLITNLTKESFTDLYAQTITYGLFVARMRTENSFNRKLAFDLIPHTIGILRDVFKFISLGELPPRMEWIVDDISEVLAVTDINQIFHQFYSEGKGSDPIIHFYETFLAEYDPKERERRGVYYTPEAVVSYIVHSLNIILKEYFNKKEGFASNFVTVLDPAAGTMTFVAQAVKLAVDQFTACYGEGGKVEFIKEHILKNFYAFELMMAPYAVGHMKIAFTLDELGYKLQKDERFKLYLTNTLEMESIKQISIPGLSSLAEESHLAEEVKKETPVLVIMGNPPYSGHSPNVGKWISDKIKEYYKVDGKPLKEKNPKWLQDDYVKFIRFAQWKIDQAGEGVLGLITNHGYLDNPTFRGMRQSLMNNFNEIYFLNLHGNSLKKERCPDGSKDENVFDIRQGVAVVFFIKKQKQETKVFYADLWGLREVKYNWLLNNNLKTTNWQKINPCSESYFFVPRSEALLEVYQKYLKITDIFPLNGVGITTARDNFVVDFDPSILLNRIRLFKNSKHDNDGLHQFFQINKKKGWDIRKAWNMLQSMSDSKLNKFILPVTYRPFDDRYIFWHDSVVWRTVKKVMSHMMEENIGILTTRFQFKKDFSWACAFISENIIDINHLQSPGTAQIFPLYIYPNKEKKGLFNQHQIEKEPNILPALFEKLSAVYGQKLTPEDIFYYIYGIFYSNIYRLNYTEFLKTDFPRIPFTKDYTLFIELGKYGKQLADLHLLKSEELNTPFAKFQGTGNNRIEKVVYQPGKVYINSNQCFEGIEEDIWEYQIGGYQVLDKWLKDRKGRMLSLGDIKNYCKIVYALKRTMEVQEELDILYQEAEKTVI